MANLVRVIFIIMKNRSTINFQKYEKIGQKISIIEKKVKPKNSTFNRNHKCFLTPHIRARS